MTTGGPTSGFPGEGGGGKLLLTAGKKAYTLLKGRLKPPPVTAAD
jgi:hypothetical protein